MVQRRPAVQIRRLNDGFGDAAADASFSADTAAIRGCGGSNLRRNGGGGDTTISRSLQRGWERLNKNCVVAAVGFAPAMTRPPGSRRRLICLAMLMRLERRRLVFAAYLSGDDREQLVLRWR